jgi:hypothetical protein
MSFKKVASTFFKCNIFHDLLAMWSLDHLKLKEPNIRINGGSVNMTNLGEATI